MPTELTSPPRALPDRRFYTRKEAAKYLREVWGCPCQPSRLDKDAMSVDGAEPLLPPPAARFGRTYLYTLDQIEGYAKRLVVKTEAPTQHGDHQ